VAIAVALDVVSEVGTPDSTAFELNVGDMNAAVAVELEQVLHLTPRGI
jgi:hypothetical protein